MLSYFRKLDWILIVSVFLLSLFSLLSLYSSSLAQGNISVFHKQLFFFALGFLLLIFTPLLNFLKLFRNYPFLITILYVLSVIFLVGLFPFAPSIRGVKSWYKIGRFSLDPVELIKLVIILILAKYFSSWHREMYRLKHLFISGLYVLIPSLLVFFQPDLGSVIVLISIWLGLLLVSGLRIRYFLVLLLIFVLLAGFGWSFLLKDYQKQRIVSFFHPELKPLSIGWNQNQSKIAIGSSSLWGKGFRKGSQVQDKFLPEDQTDFIFAAIGEEFGMIGILIIFFAYFVLVYRIIKIALSSRDGFSRFFSAGVAILLVTQFFINISGNIGLMPVIGISLPLVSYGGSGLVLSSFSLGLIQEIKEEES